MPLTNLGEKKRGFLVVSLILILIFALTAVYGLTASSLQSKQAVDEMQQQMSLSNQYLSDNLIKNIMQLQDIGSRIYDANGNLIEDAFVIFEHYAENEHFIRVSPTDKTGCFIDENGDRFSIPIEADFRRAQQGEMVLSEPFQDSESTQRVVAFLIPVKQNGKVVGIIYALKNAKDTEKELLSGFSIHMGDCAVVNGKGRILFCSDPALRSHGDNISGYLTSEEKGISWNEANSILADLGERKTGTRLLWAADGRQLISYMPFHAKPEWSLICIRSSEVLERYNNRFLYLTLCFLVLMLILIIGLMIFYNRNEKGRRDEIERISTIDPLTGIANLTKFYLLAGRILNNEQDPYTIMRLDIRNFKMLNDGFGYSTGDQVLKVVAHRLEELFHTDEACARITMDQFVVLARSREGLTAQCCRDLKQCLIDRVSQSVAQMIDFSVGSYDLIDNDESVVSAIDKCTVALKAAKAVGVPGSIMRYNDSLVRHIVEEKKLEQAMHAALKNGEFQVYIQPKYWLDDGTLIGAEALIRWVSQRFGFLPPDSFIPLFERNGFIEEIDMFVLETVMQRQCYMQSRGLKIYPISVNMSRVTVNTAHYLDKLRDLLEKYPLPAGMVELEVTESIFVGDYQILIHLLDRMRQMGCIIVMDDFGSGYSSLNLLKEVPFDILKIDREFLDEGETGQRTRAIMKSIIDMAKNIDVQVVCEGVETLEQVEFLKELRCDVAQGYYFARPMPLPQYESGMFEGTLLSQ